MTEKCSPVEMRKNLAMVDLFSKQGVDFVPIPVKNEEDKQKLVAQMMAALDHLEEQAE